MQTENIVKMNNHFKVLFVPFLLLFFLVGCEDNRSEIDKFISEIDEVLSEEEQHELINCPTTDCVISFAFESSQNEELVELFEMPRKELSAKLDSHNVKYQYFWVFVAYYNKKNDLDYSIDVVDAKLVEAISEQQQYKKEEIH